MTDKSGLSTETIEKINGVFKKYAAINQALLYGSRSQGNYRPGSDIDLTLVGADIDTTLLLKVENDLDDLLLPYQIDLSIFSQIDNPDVISHIQEHGKVFYSRV